MMKNYFVKLFFCCVLLSLTVFLFLSLRDSEILVKRAPSKSEVLLLPEKTINKFEVLVKSDRKDEAKLKYILIWTNPRDVPVVYMGQGRSGFFDRNCSHTNCYVTADRQLLGDQTKFDVVVFNGPQLSSWPSIPHNRSAHQKFAFASIESPHYYPICHHYFNSFFNWTWTFKLDSDARWGYIIIRDSVNKIIGPNKIMHWLKLKDMDPVDEEIRKNIKFKSKAAAWFVSNCHSKSSRELYVRKLMGELERYNLTVDVYGTCGPFKCSRDTLGECYKLIQKDYYFYLSFENSFSEDYVTEKLLHGLKNYAVPVVYGGANYTRFMPDGIYLNARELGPAKLAAKMNELINNPSSYEQFFRWKNHYKYYRREESIETDDYCGFCSLLNEEELVKKTTVYDDFLSWWNVEGACD